MQDAQDRNAVRTGQMKIRNLSNPLTRHLRNPASFGECRDNGTPMPGFRDRSVKLASAFARNPFRGLEVGMLAQIHKLFDQVALGAGPLMDRGHVRPSFCGA
jgi:hypothetical protein